MFLLVDDGNHPGYLRSMKSILDRYSIPFTCLGGKFYSKQLEGGSGPIMGGSLLSWSIGLITCALKNPRCVYFATPEKISPLKAILYRLLFFRSIAIIQIQNLNYWNTPLISLSLPQGFSKKIRFFWHLVSRGMQRMLFGRCLIALELQSMQHFYEHGSLGQGSSILVPYDLRFAQTHFQINPLVKPVEVLVLGSVDPKRRNHSPVINVIKSFSKTHAASRSLHFRFLTSEFVGEIGLSIKRFLDGFEPSNQISVSYMTSRISQDRYQRYLLEADMVIAPVNRSFSNRLGQEERYGLTKGTALLSDVRNSKAEVFLPDYLRTCLSDDNGVQFYSDLNLFTLISQSLENLSSYHRGDDIEQEVESQFSLFLSRDFRP